MRCFGVFVGDMVHNGISLIERGIMLKRTPEYYYVPLGGGLKLVDTKKSTNKVEQTSEVWVPVGTRAAEKVVSPVLLPCNERRNHGFEFERGAENCGQCGTAISWTEKLYGERKGGWNYEHPDDGFVKGGPCIQNVSLLPRHGDLPLIVEPEDEDVDRVLVAWRVSSGRHGDSKIWGHGNAKILVEAVNVDERPMFQTRNSEVLAILHYGDALQATRSGKYMDEITDFILTYSRTGLRLDLKGRREVSLT